MSLVKPQYPEFQVWHPLSKSLVGCWPFAENGGRKVYDVSRDEGHGAFAAALEDNSWVSSEWGAGVTQVNSKSKAILLPNKSIYSAVGNQFTLLIAMYERSAINYGEFAVKTAANNGFLFRRQSSKLYLQTFGDGGNRVAYGTSILPIQKWSIYGFSLNNNVLTFWNNGKADGGETNIRSQLGDQTLPLAIGGNIDAVIGGVWVWNRPITPKEASLHYYDPFAMVRPVRRLFKAPPPPPPPPEVDHKRLRWGFDTPKVIAGSGTATIAVGQRAILTISHKNKATFSMAEVPRFIVSAGVKVRPLAVFGGDDFTVEIENVSHVGEIAYTWERRGV